MVKDVSLTLFKVMISPSVKYCSFYTDDKYTEPEYDIVEDTAGGENSSSALRFRRLADGKAEAAEVFANGKQFAASDIESYSGAAAVLEKRKFESQESIGGHSVDIQAEFQRRRAGGGAPGVHSSFNARARNDRLDSVYKVRQLPFAIL